MRKWWQSRKDKGQLTEDELETRRYDGRPLVKILEYYILDCIGQLTEQDQTEIRAAVQAAFGGGDDWHATVGELLQLDEVMDRNFREMWEANQVIAREADAVLLPLDYARMVVDANFADEIERFIES